MTDIESGKAEVHSYEGCSMALYSEQEIQHNIGMMKDLLEQHPEEIPEFVFRLVESLSDRFEDVGEEGGSK